MNGYLMTTPPVYRTSTYAIVSDNYRAGTASDWFLTRDLLDSVQVQVNSDRPIFVGFAHASAVSAYLDGVAREEGPRFDAPHSAFVTRPGGAPRSLPENFPSGRPASLEMDDKDDVAGPERRLANRGDERRRTRSVTANLTVGARFPRLLMMGVAALGLGDLGRASGSAELRLVLRRT